jgi:ribonuclease VapC
VIVDTSAVVAVIFREPGYEALVEKLAGGPPSGIGAATLVETGIVVSARLGRDARGLLARFVQEAGLAVVPFGEAHSSTAVDAWLRFGRGRHPAALNLGDCLAYATAKLAARPLLCVGDDFARTDLEIA